MGFRGDSQSVKRWIEHGASLIAAAKFLYDSLPKEPDLVLGTRRFLESGQFHGAITLLGAGLECVLKARAIADGLIVSRPGVGIGRLKKPWSSHDLRGMALALDLSLSEADLVVLQRASHGIRWLGRYPDPKERRDLEEAVSIGAQILSPKEFEAALRIHSTVRQSVRT